MYRPTVKTATATWLAGTTAALVVQGVFPRQFAATTAWGSNDGWQREIAIWNLGTVVAGAALITGHDADPVRSQLRGLAVLSTLFGINHVVAAVETNKPGNWAWAAINAGGLVTAVAALTGRRH